MDYLTKEVMHQIEDELGKKLVSLGVAPTTLFWDTTNFSTCIENWGEKRLPQSGFAKDKRFDRNIVGLGVAVSDENIPFFHETYPGNEHDSKVLSRMIEHMVDRLETLKIKAKDVVLVFDQGGNSPENIASILDKMHIIGSLKRNQVEDLIDLPLQEFKFLYKSKRGGRVYAHRVKREFWNKEFTVIITYNENTAKRQQRSWNKAKERIKQRMNELAEKYSQKSSRGRKMSLKGLTQSIHDLIHKQYRALIRWEVDQDTRCLTWYIDETAEAKFKNRFGKSAIFTDMHKWSPSKIVRTYHRKHQLEDDFKWLHGKLNLPVPPYYVRLDHRIREHAFLCVLGMLFLRYLGRKLSSLHVSPQRIWTELERLRVALIKDVKTGESQFMVEKMNTVQAIAFEKLELAQFLNLN
jgi:transposase